MIFFRASAAFSLGLERTGGFETVAFCEIEPFPRRVLAKHWPEVLCYEDVRTLTAERLSADGIAVDVVTGGFPCQDVSTAGKRRGMGEGTRSGLYSEVIRIVGDLRPRYVVLENVANLLVGPSEQPGGWFGRVLGDLAAVGYDAEWHCIPASHLGALHQRDRIWIVAYPHTDRLRLQRIWSPPGGSWTEEQFAGLVQVALQHAIPARSGGGIHDGVPNRSHRLKALGNAVVPQIPEMIGRAILAAELEAAE